MTSYSIIHISDLHIRERSEIGNYQTLAYHIRRRGLLPALASTWKQPIGQSSHDSYVAKQVAKFLGSIRQDNAALIISGDLAAQGSEADLQAAHKMLEAQAYKPEHFYLDTRGRATFGGLDLNIIVVPGNHDRFRSPPRFSAGGQKFDKVFNKYWKNPGLYVQANVLGDDNEQSPLAIIAADLCLLQNAGSEGAFNYLGQGKAHRFVREILLDATLKVRSKRAGVGIIWLCHFPPAAPGCANSLKLIEGEQLLQDAQEAGVNVIIAGHLHREMLFSASDVDVACAGSAMAFMCEDGYWVHRLQIEVENCEARLVERKNFRWDAYTESFLEILAA